MEALKYRVIILGFYKKKLKSHQVLQNIIQAVLYG